MKILCRSFLLSFLTLFVVTFFSNKGYASRAQVLVFGSGDPTGYIFDGNGNGGSFYQQSAYSAFIHPALLLGSEDQLLIEKSDYPGSAAQGAAIKSVGPVKLGLFLGRQGDAAFYQRASSMRQIELFGAYAFSFMDIGLGLSYFGSDQPNKINDRNFKVRFGTAIKLTNFTIEPFGFITADGIEESSPPAVYRHYDYQLGLRSVVAKELFFTGGYRRYWRKTKNTTLQTVQDAFGVGVAHKAAVDEKTRIIYGTGFWRHTSSRRNIVPVNLSGEYDLLSWLTIRGGLEYHIIDKDHKTSTGDNTTGRFGLTAKKDRFALDWVIGSNSNTSGAATAVAEQNGQMDTQSFGFDAGFFTAASLSFKL